MEQARFILRAAVLTFAATALLAVTCLCVDLSEETHARTEMWRRLPTIVDLQLSETRAAAVLEIEGERKDLNAQLSGLRVDTRRTSADLIGAMNRIADEADTRLASIEAETLDRVDGVRGDLKPVLHNAASLENDAQASLDDLYPDLKSAVESVDVAATSTAQATEVVRDATPKLVATVQRIGDNSDKTTALTAKTMEHIEEDTRTLPKWLRTTIQIAPAAVPAVGIWELLHK